MQSYMHSDMKYAYILSYLFIQTQVFKSSKTFTVITPMPLFSRFRCQEERPIVSTCHAQRGISVTWHLGGIDYHGFVQAGLRRSAPKIRCFFLKLGGGFKHFLCSPPFGEDSQFD